MMDNRLFRNFMIYVIIYGSVVTFIYLRISVAFIDNNHKNIIKEECTKLENSEIILAYEQKFRFKPSVTVLYKEGERIDIKEIVIKTDGIRAVSRYIEDNNIIKYLMYINFINLCLIPIIMKTKKIKI